VISRPNDSHERTAWRTHALGRHAPLLVMAVGTVLSVLTFAYIRSEETAGREREFQRRAANTALRVADYPQRREELLFALRNFFEYSGEVTREQFAGFARDLRSRQVGIHALEWVPLVPSSAAAKFVRDVRAEGFPNFDFAEHTGAPNQVRRTGDRAMHAPVLYIEPLTGNEAALGFDLASDARSWPRLQQYTRDGTLVASGLLPLLVPPRAGQPGATSSSCPSIDARRR
jgi:CHASE1-domain containing sensor protein